MGHASLVDGFAQHGHRLAGMDLHTQAVQGRRALADELPDGRVVGETEALGKRDDLVRPLSSRRREVTADAHPLIDLRPTGNTGFSMTPVSSVMAASGEALTLAAGETAGERRRVPLDAEIAEQFVRPSPGAFSGHPGRRRARVLNTVVLDTRDRVHDPGVLKALGMSPRQTVAMGSPRSALSG
jgi:hypothetical protein